MNIVGYSALVAAVLGCLYGSYHYGYQRALSEGTQTVLELEQQYRIIESAHQEEVSALKDTYVEEKQRADLLDARLAESLERGPTVMRLPAKCASSPKAPTASTPSRGADGAGRAELTPAAATALWTIALDGDRAIRKLNALQEWARKAQKLCGNLD